MFYIEMTILNEFPLEDEPVNRTGQFKQSLDSFYVTDSPLTLCKPWAHLCAYIKERKLCTLY